MIGRWQGFAGNLTAKFLITGALMYIIGCFQGSTEALQALQRPTHFTDFVIAHSHLTIFGTFVLWALAGVVYVWPRVSGRELYSFRMANWGYWLITHGHLRDGCDSDSTRITARFHADCRRRVARLACLHASLLVVQNVFGDLHGRGYESSAA